LVTLGVLVASVLVRYGGYAEVDLIAALGVSVFIAAAGVRVLWRNLGYLTDAALVDPKSIESLVLQVPGVASAHKIRTRGTPMRVYVDLHIQIAPHLVVADAHRVTHWVIDAIRGGMPDVVDVMVHTEPAHPDVPHRPLPDRNEQA
jgi:cation diffusion facilitator family transporter